MMATTWEAVERMDGLGAAYDGEQFLAAVRYAIGVVAEYAEDLTPTLERRLNGRVWVTDGNTLPRDYRFRLVLDDRRDVDMVIASGPDPTQRYRVVGVGLIRG